jgi:integrase
MSRKKITQSLVEQEPPATGRIEIFDTLLPGFGLRISASGTKAWFCMYRVNGEQKRETIGKVALIPSVADARELARKSMLMAQAGRDPVAIRKQAIAEATEAAEEAKRQTLAAVLDRYLERRRKGSGNKKPIGRDYYEEMKRTFARDVAPVLGERPISQIRRKDIQALLDGIVDRGAPAHACHVLSYLTAALNWAVAQDGIAIAKSPAAGVEMPAALVSRDRTLDDGEIVLFWKACSELGYPFGDLFKLLLLTAQRRDELAQAPWSEFNLEQGVWEIPGSRTKNGRPHTVHLSREAVAILNSMPAIDTEGNPVRSNGPRRSPYVFTTTGSRPVTGFSNAATKLTATMSRLLKAAAADDDAAVAPFRLHDLRRTATTKMAKIGVAPHVADRVLNHVGGTIRGVAAIYNRFDYLPDRKAALEALALHIGNLVDPPPPAEEAPPPAPDDGIDTGLDNNVSDFAAERRRRAAQ